MARADHIMVPRLGGVFVHHGIDCGDGTVIHFTGETWTTPRSVQRTPLKEFARGAEVASRDYHEFFERLQRPEELPRRMTIRWRRELMRLAGSEGQSKAFAADAVIERAESRLGRADFDLVFNNCEHFATWCKTGISDSEQVYALWRTILDPMTYVRLRRSNVMTALFDRGLLSGPVRPGRDGRKPHP
jgi:hypothetical protein